MNKILLFLVFCVMFSIGCAALTSQNSAATPTSFEETETAAVSPTPLPDNIAEMLDGEPLRLLVVPQKFSAEANAFTQYEVDDTSLSVADKAQNFIISFIADENEDDLPLKELLGQYFAAFEKRQMIMEYQPSVDIAVDGNQGVRIDFSGQVQEQTLEGSAIAIQSDEEWVLIGVGMANTQNSQTVWKDNGLPNFEQILTSIKFLDVTAECPVSTDDTYGYTSENPIKVGGDVFGGASRERAYLDHLLDSNGNAVTYERSSSGDFGDVVLDIYVVTTSAGDEAILYVDMYNYTPPQAPVKFTCQGAFPLSAP